MRQLSKGNKLNTEKVKPVSAGQSKEEFNRKIKEPEYVKDLRERCVKAYIVAEKNRTACDDTIRNEYETKTILFGYIALFGCSFSLAPLIFLIVCLFDLRIDGKRLIWLYQRPVGMRAQDIGNWYYICTFLNALGIITNGLIISFTSNWSDNGLIKDSYTNRLLFFIVFEHFMFVLWFVIKWLIPDISIDVKKRMEEEMYHVNAVMFSEKLEKKKQSKANENQTITETSETVKNKKKHRQRDELIEDREAESLKYENNLPPLPKKYEKVQRRLVKEDSMRYYDDSLKILNV